MSDAINVAPTVHALEQQKHGSQSSHKDYGYPATQEIIDILMDDDNCDWLVVTNGDNFFGPLFFEHTEVFDEKSASIVGVDFATHHLRTARDGQEHKYQRVEVAMSMGSVDLSSVLLRRKTLAECPSAKFFPRVVRKSFLNRIGLFFPILSQIATLVPSWYQKFCSFIIEISEYGSSIMRS